LGAVKTEFGKFGGVLDKVQRQLRTVSTTIEDAGTRTRVMERKLRAVEQMDPTESATILALPAAEGQGEELEENESLQRELPGAA
jgi:DNA recombination protein RmuC